MPLCDEHKTPMYPEELLTHSVVYECRSLNCRRYFSPGGGYFCALPQVLAASTEVDSKEQSALVCPEKGEEHSFMAVVSRRVPNEGDTHPWCFYCYDCKREFSMTPE